MSREGDREMTSVEHAAVMLQAIATDQEYFWAHASDGMVLEFPYAPWLHRPVAVFGRENVEPHLADVVRRAPGLSFVDVTVIPMAEPGAFVLEYRTVCPAKGYSSPYITIMRFADGQLVSFREYWNTTEIKRVFA
jgi:ketosteroid isomerase-like protein